MARAPGRRGGGFRVEVLGTGDELVRGRSRDTNFPRIAEALTDAGFEVAGGRIVGDDLEAVVDALRRAAGRARAVVMTGGLGPTADDLTREAAAEATGAPLVAHAPSARRLRALWRRRGLPMPESNLRQALLPRGAVPLANAVGSAPGLRFRLGQAEVFCLPGPPREMEPMLRRLVLPALRRLAPGLPAARTAWVACCGVPESVVAERIADLMERGREVRVGTTAADGVVTVSVHGRGAAAREVPRVRREVLRRLGEDAYAAEKVPPGEALVRRLLAAGLTVSTAESCTAGLVAAALTDLPGSSGAYLGGVVAYDDRVKVSALGVPRALLARGGPGAVSRPVAEAMATGIRRRTGSDLSVAVTGIAGPGGARPGKPVGLVWFAVATARGVRSEERRFPGDRGFVRALAAHTAIDLLRRALPGRRGKAARTG